MPFTFSHPAIILPFFKNEKLSITGLVIGSMSPDFEYFIRMGMQSKVSHTFLGILLVDLPLGILGSLLFHEIIKRPLIENLPTAFQKRLYVLKESKWIDYSKNNIILVLISFLIGIISHILWDSLTHKTGYFVREIFLLNNKIYTVPFYKIMQHASSLIGMIFILFFLYKLPFENESVKKIHFKYWFLIVFFAFTIITIRFLFETSYMQIGNAVVSVISATILAITFASLIFRKQ